VSTLSILADQVSIAIKNASLYEETQRALTQSESLYQQFTKSGWSQLTQTHKVFGIRRSEDNNAILREPIKYDDLKNNYSLDLPIILRGQKIGFLKLQAEGSRQWTQDDVDIATAIIDRAALSMENARLLDNAQRRATREHIISEIASTVSSSTDIEIILRNTVQELGRKMGGAEVVLELGADIENNIEQKGSVQQ
jgi:hypothetical protein